MGDLVGQSGWRKNVLSVALSVPSFLSVSGSPITDSGTLAVTLATQAANLVFAGPTSGGAATPTFRALVVADIPVLDDTRLANAVILAPTLATRNVIILTDSGTNATVNVITLDHDSSGTPAANFGTGIHFRGKSSTTSNRSMGRIRTEWVTATDGSRSAKMILSRWEGSAESDLLTLNNFGLGIGSAATAQALEIHVASARMVVDSTTVTNIAAIQLNNGGGAAFFAIERSTGGALGTGTTGYALCITSPNASTYPIHIITANTIRMTVLSDGKVAIGNITPTSLLDVNGDIEVVSTGAHYFGDPTTDGSWRIVRSGNDLVIERRVAGSWVTKSTIAA